MSRRTNLAGQRFGKLVTKEFKCRGNWGQALWTCICDCGSTFVTTCQNLTNGDTRSCGCLYQISRPANGKTRCTTVEEKLLRHSVNQGNRRARKARNGGTHTVAQWIRLKTDFGNICLCCGKSETELATLKRILVADHIVPIAKGGSSDISNLQPLCHSIKLGSRGGCNNAKHSRSSIDFRYLFLLLMLAGERVFV
jgi:5-methylcytosine-specific restriction endonuclease McrA